MSYVGLDKRYLDVRLQSLRESIERDIARTAHRLREAAADLERDSQALFQADRGVGVDQRMSWLANALEQVYHNLGVSGLQYDAGQYMQIQEALAAKERNSDAD